MNLNKEKNIINSDYINNIENLIDSTNNSHELKKYTKWYLFARYVNIIFNLQLQDYTNIDCFIEKSNTLFNNNKNILVYNISIPNKKILNNAKQYLDNNNINFMNDIIYDYTTNRYLSKMIKNIYYIISDDNTIYWHFKDTNSNKKTTNLNSKKKYIPISNYNNVFCNHTKYNYIYDLIKNSCVLYLYIIVAIVKFYTNINILKYSSFRRLLYIINFNR